MHFVHFGLESGMVFKGTTGVSEHFLSFQFQMNKNEVEICEFEKYLKKIFVCSLIYEMMTKFLPEGQVRKTGMGFRGLVWKRVWKMTRFGLK